MKYLLPCLLVSLMAWGEPAWQNVDSPSEGFHCQLPAGHLEDALQAGARVISLNEIRYSFTLTSADLHGLTPELVIASVVSGSKVKVSQRGKIDHQGHPGCQLVGTLADDSQRYLWARVVAVPPRTYILLARFSKPQDQTMAEKFFQSFRLDPKAQP